MLKTKLSSALAGVGVEQAAGSEDGRPDGRDGECCRQAQECALCRSTMKDLSARREMLRDVHTDEFRSLDDKAAWLRRLDCGDVG